MDEDTTFGHIRESDSECVGYLRMTDDGKFIPIDLLWNEIAGPMDLDDAEAILDSVGLGYLADNWLLEVPDHPKLVKVRIQEITSERIVLSNADFDYPANIGVTFTETNPTFRLHRTSD